LWAHDVLMTQTRWSNWAGTATARPEITATPHSTEQLQRIVADAAERGKRVKPVGAGHSFTDMAVTDGVLVNLDHLAGITDVRREDDGTALVTVLAGTRLRALNEALWELGLALANLGDIDKQSISGAFSTGTHGTGAAFGGLPTMIRALDIVLADGSLVHASPEENPQLFEAARLSLGAVGVIVAVTLACVPAFLLRAEEGSDSLDATFERLDEDCAAIDHFEFFWFPHTRQVQTKRNTRLPVSAGVRPISLMSGLISDELLSNTLFEGINRIGARVPSTIPAINKASSRVLGSRTYTDRSYRVFASPRRVRFREMEYGIPAASVKDVLAQIDAWITKTGFTVAFPVEVRFAAADDVWLSMANGRDTAYIAVHQYHRRPHDAYFRAVEDIARAVGGRPHWGKMHYRTYADLEPDYPRLAEFVEVRDQHDPDGVFGNLYTKRVLG
jgi:L-gulonolactone oxidase